VFERWVSPLLPILAFSTISHYIMNKRPNEIIAKFKELEPTRNAGESKKQESKIGVIDGFDRFCYSFL
jgi:hypothetical protein